MVLTTTPTSASTRPTVYASNVQRAAIHLQALGIVGLHHEHASAFDAAGRRLLSKGGGRSAVHFTPEDMRVMRGQSGLHNHPSGGSFSPDDISLGSRYEMTLHVVGATPAARARAASDARQGGSAIPQPAYLFTMRFAPVPAGIVRGSSEHADYLLARTERIRTTYNRVERVARTGLAEAVRAGALAVGAADLVFHHHVWNQVANALPDDLSYTWEILTP